MKFNERLKDLKNYEAGKPIELVVREFGIKPEDVIKLASNENPYGCSSKVVEAIKNEAIRASQYPDDSMYELKEMLASKYSLKSENFIIGSGSDQIIEFLLHAKIDSSSKILTSGITFAMYEIYAKHIGATTLKSRSAQYNLDELLEIYKQNRGIEVIFLCVPNNPLGDCVDRKDIYKFLKEIDKDTLVVIDGAYQEFASYKDEAKKIYPKELIETFPNTIYLGTFSKAYGLGGMRVGYGVANEEIISILSKIRPPFNITTLSLKAAIVALSDEEFIKKCIEENFTQMIRYEKMAKELNVKYIPSYTNFITFMLEGSKNSTNISQKLLKKSIIVRDLASYGINAIRVTIGMPKQNDVVLEELRGLYS